MEQLKISTLWPDLSHTLAAPLLESAEYPWEILKKISDFILSLGATLSEDEYDQVAEGVWVAKDAKVAPTAYLGAPCIIGHKTEVRHCAFIRGSALVGEGCVAYCAKSGEGTAPTVQLTVNYHRPIIPGDYILVNVHVLSASKSLMHLRSEAYREENPEKICLSGNSVFFNKA